MCAAFFWSNNPQNRFAQGFDETKESYINNSKAVKNFTENFHNKGSLKTLPVILNSFLIICAYDRKMYKKFR